MTRRDFELIAEVLRTSQALAPKTRMALASQFANRLAATNDRFDRKRFLHAALADQKAAV